MRVLLVEDDALVARFIKKGLEAERYQVEVAADGVQGLEMAQTIPYTIIVLDVVLPKASGVQVCRQLRSGGVHTPILMLTAKDSVESKVTGLTAGADDYLTKPFAFEELLARIQALLRRPASLDLEPRLQLADLVLDRNTHEVRRSGRLIELTAREFALLEFMMRRPERVMSRTMLEEQVWGYREDPLTNVVDVYIRRLRQKVDRGFKPPLIHTVRGIGYTLKA